MVLTVKSAMAFLPFSILMSLLVVVAASAELREPRSASNSDKPTVIQVCEILKQSQGDIAMCYDKARNNHIREGKKPHLIYLCCLGYFNDVKENYMPSVSIDLLRFIVRTDKPDELRGAAKFIVGCKDTDGKALTLRDFSAWWNSQEPKKTCRAFG